MYDIIIIGAGPAGLTAAIYARRAQKSVLLIEKSTFGGQMTFSPKVENYPGISKISGNELADGMVSQAIEQGADLELDEVVRVDAGGAPDYIKTVKCKGGVYTGRALIIAAGARHRMLGLPNEEKFIGDGISYCAVCDGAFYIGKSVAVIGGGNSALQEALLLSDTCKKVIIVQNLGCLTGEVKLQQQLYQRDNIEVMTETVVKSIIGDDKFEGIVTERVSDGSAKELFVDGMFVAIGLVPENDPYKNVVRLDERGYIIADETCATGTPGVFAAGDCRTKSVRQITTATADGAVAALSACRFVDELSAVSVK